MSKKDRKDQYLHEISYNEVLVIDENMGLCINMSDLQLLRTRKVKSKKVTSKVSACLVRILGLNLDHYHFANQKKLTI